MKTVRVKIGLSLQMEDGVESGVSANTDQGELEILVPLICPRYLHTLEEDQVSGWLEPFYFKPELTRTDQRRM